MKMSVKAGKINQGLIALAYLTESPIFFNIDGRKGRGQRVTGRARNQRLEGRGFDSRENSDSAKVHKDVFTRQISSQNFENRRDWDMINVA